MRLKAVRPIIGATLFLTTLAVASLSLDAQDSPLKEEFVSARPLGDVVSLLTELYGKPVTLEEPVWEWRGDVVIRGSDENAPSAQLLKDRAFRWPEWLTPERTPRLNSAVLGRMLDAYHAQNADGARYRVLGESRLGFPIVPASFHNAAGQIVAASSLLDARITVPSSVRMASEHFKALRDAIKAATGTDVWDGSQKLDQAFAANGIVPPGFAAELLPASEKARYSFVWGARDVTAREALLQFIDQSATTLEWQLRCHPSARREDRFCVLNFTPLVVKRTGPDGDTVRKTVFFDRRPDPIPGPSLPMPDKLRQTVD